MDGDPFHGPGEVLGALVNRSLKEYTNRWRQVGLAVVGRPAAKWQHNQPETRCPAVSQPARSHSSAHMHKPEQIISDTCGQ
ncbi:unnamed protein product [Nippostrongylus brasiliensis]|uniref:DUF4113 domain-containing protein n=1 Tax=Nippostrongylus brasiliensis TaxID=27835 RepID=A0A0N4YHD7_NIPBR|nr:hypothetical protein Q1695_005306 [Nippostrongylus brasiliensis]VDL79866.1 unnamed protein product [Nippostrongylus brasiliensis]